MNSYYVYIMSNSHHTTLYIGVTNDLQRRVSEHKSGEIKGFSQKYNLHELVYYEGCGDVNDAIRREKQLKAWSRAKKENLIETLNPEWHDLSRE